MYTWRIDLTKTEQYWRGWFQGLSKLFLSIPQAKLLILAGVDRLDKELTIGQMQGWYARTHVYNKSKEKRRGITRVVRIATNSK